MRQSSRAPKPSSVAAFRHDDEDDVRTQARALLGRLINARVVCAGVRYDEELLVAAAKASAHIEASGDDDDATVRPFVPRGARIERLRRWIGLLRQLGQVDAPTVVTTLGRGAARSCRAGETIGTWVLERVGGELSHENLPVEPLVWQLLAADRVGASCRSATRLGNLLQGYASMGRLAVHAMDDGVPASLPLAALATVATRPRYARVTLTAGVVRAALLAVTTGATHGLLASLRQPQMLGASGLAFECTAAPKACEGVGQIWLSYESGLSACHFDAPHGVLVCLGGEREVLLMPPRAPALLGVPGVSLLGTSMAASVDAFELLSANADRVRGIVQVARMTPGTALFIPHGWWHQVRSSGDAAALSIPVCARRMWTASPGNSMSPSVDALGI